MVNMSFMWTVLSEVPNQIIASRSNRNGSDNYFSNSSTGDGFNAEVISITSLDAIAPANGPSSIVFRCVRYSIKIHRTLQCAMLFNTNHFLFCPVASNINIDSISNLYYFIIAS